MRLRVTLNQFPDPPAPALLGTCGLAPNSVHLVRDLGRGKS